MKRFKSAGQAQRFLSAHDQINNLFHLHRDHVTAAEHRASRSQTFQVWAEICSGLAINSDFCLARDMNTADPMLQVDGAPPSSSALRSCGRSVVGLPKPKMHVFCLHLVDLFLAKTAWIPDPNSGPSGRRSGFLEAKTPNYGCDPI